MIQSKMFAAIDIGTTKIVALVGLKTPEGKLELLGIEKVPSTGVKRGVVINIEETSNAIREVVTKLETKLGIKMSEVHVGIAGQHIKSIKNRGYRYIDPSNEIKQSDVDLLTSDNYKIPVEIDEEILHVIPQDYVVDNESGIKQPVGMSGHRLEGNFHIVMGRSASVKNIKKCIHRVGLQLSGMILEPLASAISILTDEEKEAGVVLVDIGGGTTDVAVFYDHIIRHTAVIPFGGNVITSDIKEGCAVLYKQAETLKTQFGSAIADEEREDQVVTIPGISGWEPKEISFKSLSYIIQARMEEIVDYVMHQINASGCMDKLGAGIVLTGGGAMLRNLGPLIKLRTGFDVRIGIPDQNLSSPLPRNTAVPMYSTSIGLLLSAIEKPALRIIEPELFGDFEVKTIEEKRPVKSSRKETPKRVRKEGTLSLFDTLKTGFAGIFDDKIEDSVM